MYTIKQAASLTGVPADTLRAWERRYGVPSTVRSDGGYRLYDDHSLDMVRRMRTLIDGGQAAAQAAEAVLTLDHGDSVPSPEEFVESVIAGPVPDEELSRRLLLALDAGPFTQTADSWLMPMLRYVGHAWSEGRLTPGEEHVISATVMRRLSTAYDRLLVTRGAPVVLVGLPAGSRHEIAALAFALLLRQSGYDTAYLGPDLPTDAWLHAVASYEPDAIVLSVLRGEDESASQTLRALAEIHPDVPAFIGGPYVGEIPASARKLPPTYAAACQAFVDAVPAA